MSLRGPPLLLGPGRRPAVVQPLAPAQGDGDDEDGETAGPGGGESAGSEEERGAEK